MRNQARARAKRREGERQGLSEWPALCPEKGRRKREAVIMMRASPTFCTCARHFSSAIGWTRSKIVKSGTDHVHRLATHSQQWQPLGNGVSIGCFFFAAGPKHGTLQLDRGSSRWIHSGRSVARTARINLQDRQLFFFFGMVLVRRSTFVSCQVGMWSAFCI